MTWIVDSESDSGWVETEPMVPEGICIAGLLVPGIAVAGVGYGFWPFEDAAAATVWTE